MCSAAVAAAPVGVQVIVIRHIVVVMADVTMLAVKKDGDYCNHHPFQTSFDCLV
jgi:hypothetical protein